MNKIEKLGAKIISQITINGRFGWPPDCSGFIYQPERPVDKSAIVETSEAEAPNAKHIHKK